MKDYKYKINGNEYTVSVGEVKDNLAEVKVNGVDYAVEIVAEAKAAPVVKAVRPAVASAPAAQAAPANKPSAGGPGSVKAPLPGVITTINVKVGDAVKASDVVAILEAMKMENNVMAGKDGVVKSISVNKGDSVLEGTEILVIG